jgi:uncharacterized protein (UPF0276 family)
MTFPTAQGDPRFPYLGFGLRLRRDYVPDVLRLRPDVGWFEIISENYMDGEPDALRQLDAIRTRYPLTMHGISLAIGSPWPLDMGYLERLKKLLDRVDPAWVSDHLCWSGADDSQGRMLPLPYAQETLEHVVSRILEVQDYLGRRILLENVPVERGRISQEIPETEFLREVAERSDSLILLDISNLHTTCVNQGLKLDEYIKLLPENRVQQIHLAGAMQLCEPEACGDESMKDPIWDSYSDALSRFGPVSTMIERIDCIPSLEDMVGQLHRARRAAAAWATVY